eukprot:CAMPEP_0201943826 /NCGR_PEP_ID=MMETSP0903-20130614/51900_1 /ASSEMBLY_ACC=CAM_ASM_000552 /TAXON_ID=420261 /ORGANISM="Thalassiosira antarctica, Strain CCMP982" /LENGTH=418 /DNA_ID=CAMNT_0048486653 /DNA_START=57 /DNA_END=1313 /DNA_ORIENTATION=-
MRLTSVTVLQLLVLLMASITSAQSSHYFPDSQIVLDMAVLSHSVYHLRKKVQSCHTLINLLQEEMAHESSSSNNQTDEAQDIYQRLLPNGTECLHYHHDYSLGTQVLVVRSSLHKYVAVAYAGTDDWNTMLKDGEIFTSDFGPNPTDNSTNDDVQDNNNISPIFQGVPEGVRVHRGFNSAVFDNDGFHTILNCISSARLGGNCDDNGSVGDTNMDTHSLSSPYQLFTTGHSLGAADSVLLGAALHLAYPNEKIRSINFGCPKVGNIKWSFWIDSLQPDKGGQTTASSDDGDIKKSGSGSFEIFRFVNKIDLVPRLPELLWFTHAGHTLQMSVGGDIRAYYDHLGNEDLGYAGVPFGWEAAAYAFLPGALASHISKHYVEYLEFYPPNQPSTNSSNVSTLYYVRDFERVEDNAQVYSYA